MRNKMKNRWIIIFIAMFSIFASIIIAGCWGNLGDPSVSYYNAPGAPVYTRPVITDFTPKMGFYGDEVTITGSNFGAEQGDGEVNFTGDEASYKSWTDSEIIVYVPSSARTGILTVSNAGGQYVSTTTNFIMLSWDTQYSSTYCDFYGSFFIDETRGWLVGDDRIYSYDDGIWSYENLDPNYVLYSISMVDADTGWAAGGYKDDGYVLHTTDGWVNWNEQYKVAGHWLRGISFVKNANNKGWAVGDGGVIWHTSDGGISWGKQNSQVTDNLNDVQFLDENNGWAVGSSGKILHTNNGGADWNEQNSGITNKLYSLYMLDTTDGWAVGSQGAILHYNNGTWNLDRLGDTTFMAVFFLNDQQGWIAGSDGMIYHTEDGGTTWKYENSGTYRPIMTIFFVSRKQGWAGYYGTIKYCHSVW
ncbi:MAG: IPT/TIG domain-containing protein [Candidatus Eremiobacteraeota bacterium]|nr:IPT/TIG domain-containing protein [Candidatus Eremiobacteraeota bacterium]